MAKSKKSKKSKKSTSKKVHVAGYHVPAHTRSKPR